MAFVPLRRFLVRAPLLRWRGLEEAGARLLREPLGKLALELASPSLMAGPQAARETAGSRDAGARRAIERYGRRAAFRATPSGLLAGVTVGELGRGSDGATGRPRAHLDLAWSRVAALGRALLEDPGVRRQVRLRQAPSLLRGADRVRWLAFGEAEAEQRQAELDARLARILDACRAWAPWAAARAAADDGGGGDSARTLDEIDGLEIGGLDAPDDIDELLLLLLDDGLLHCDLIPPLVGPPPAEWMAARLARLRPRPVACQALAGVRRALAAGDVPAARIALADLPGQPEDPDQDWGITAVLVHQPTRVVRLDQKTVERAARLAPLLFRLQQALASPAAERFADSQPLRDALVAAEEIFGAGALEVQSLALGEYGVEPGEDADGDDGAASGAPAPPFALIRLLIDELAAARAAGRGEIALSAIMLDRLLPAAAPPPTAELFFTPSAARSGAGWLLGLHAPAGASWGRFASALGDPLVQALAALTDAEAAAHPDQRRLDVAYAPSAALADLCAHPTVRSALLALSSWPSPGDDPETEVITPADLELIAGADASDGLDPVGGASALRKRAGDRSGARAAAAARAASPEARDLEARAPSAEARDLEARALVPSPLARVRSATAPGGLFQLLVGWSLYRQHAPWALALGPLADLGHVPRITLDGFVISPASWRIPAELAATAAGRRLLRRWREGGEDGGAAVPRFVQVGAEDELLPVDLDHPNAVQDLAGHPRAWEIWPPLSAGRGGGGAHTIDRDGRRIEAVVALIDLPDADERRRAHRDAALVARAPVTPAPRVQPPAPGWQTFKLFAAEDRQDALLLDAVAPAVREALAAGEIDRWFFQRYVDGPGRRPHLRVRAHRPDAPVDHAGGLASFAARLQARLGPLRAAGALASVESGEYHAEPGRFGGGGALAAVEAIFQSDSQLCCDWLSAARLRGDGPDAPDPIDRMVMAFDALAAGLGLSRPDRHLLARRRRDAHAALLPAPDREERRTLDSEFRARARGLRAALGASAAETEAGIAAELEGDRDRDDDRDRGGRRDPLERALMAHQRRVTIASAGLAAAARAALASDLLHLSAVRAMGPHRELEARATLFWERTLEGLLRSPAR